MGGQQQLPAEIVKRILNTHMRGELAPMHGAEVAEIRAQSPHGFCGQGVRHVQGRASIVARRRRKRIPTPALTALAQGLGVSPTGRHPSERPLAIFCLFLAPAPVLFSIPLAPLLEHRTPSFLPHALHASIHGCFLA